MKLSKDFSLAEFTRSDKATELGIENNPSNIEVERILDLVNYTLQPLRDLIEKPVNVLSGFRSEAVNEAVGGEKNSQHKKGEAADVRVNGYSSEELGKVILKAKILGRLQFDQLIIEPTWVHVSYKRGFNRGEVLIAEPIGAVNGKIKYIYKKIDLTKWPN